MTTPRRKLNSIKRELDAARPSESTDELPPQPSILPPPPRDKFMVRNAKRLERHAQKLHKVTSSISYVRPRNVAIRHRNKPRKLVKNLVFSKPTTVEISIIIPIFNKFELTYRCLKSLVDRVSKEMNYEVIVVDNNSTDSSSEFNKVPGLRYIRNAANRGFVEGCNIGANAAKGNYLVFLNNDTVITKNWLESLYDTIVSHPTVGLVGSKILYMDGRLQEAGGVIFKDGSGNNYGKNDHPDRYQYNYVREVDYCSGASIIVAKKVFDKLKGFDMLYAPAYYEDTDLAFRIRKLGLKVIYQPESVIYHVEGATSGTDISSGFKRYQAINHKKFLKRWRDTLESGHYESDQLYPARDRSGKKMILIVDEHTPTPDKDSGSVRMMRMIRLLQTLDYKVTFYPNHTVKQPKYADTLQQMGVEIVYGPTRFDQFIEKYGKYYDAVLLSRPRIGAYYMDLCQAFCPKAKIIYDTVDLHYVRLRRQAVFESASLNKYYLDVADKHEILEKYLIAEADTALVVSEAEKKLLNKEGFHNVKIVSNIHVLNESSYLIPLKNRKDLIFVGGFSHIPNIDAIKWFVKEVFPLILKDEPSIRLHVVGSEMPGDLQANLEKKRGVIVEGFVEDLEPLLKSSRLLVAPMRYGAGVKGKIGQAIEYGLPVVTTSIGAEGMYLNDGQSTLIGNTPKEFASAVSRLYHDEKLWKKIQANARKIIETHFSEERATKDLSNIVT